MPRACVFGCQPSHIRHAFPNHKKFPEQYKAWVRIVSGKDECDLKYRQLKVCDRHFTAKDRNRNNRLNALAVPSRFLPSHLIAQTPTLDLPELSDIEKSSSDNVVPKPVAKPRNPLRDHNYFNLEGTNSKKKKNTLSNHAALSDATVRERTARTARPSAEHIREPSPPPQLHLHTAQMCRVCLALDVKMFDLRDSKLKIMFQSITGITFEENKGSKLGSLLCWECAARLKAAATFRSKALFSDSLLQSLINQGEQIQKVKFETVKELADGLAPKTLTVTEVFHIVDIEGQNNMTEESIMEKINDENTEMDIAGDDNVAINTDIEYLRSNNKDDSICPTIEEENMIIILEGNPLHSTSSIEETINSGYSRPLQDIGQTSHQSDLTTSQEDCDNQIIITYLESTTKSEIVPQQNKRLLNPIKRSKRAVIHDQPDHTSHQSDLTTSQEDCDNQIIITYLENTTNSEIVPQQNIRLLNPIKRSKRAVIHDQPIMLYTIERTDNNEIEESIIEEINNENTEMDIAGDDNVAIITEIEDDSICPTTVEENMTIILEGNPLHSTSSIEETINSGCSRPLQDIGQSPREDFDDQIINTFLESITKSKKVPKKNIQTLNPIKRTKRAVTHDQSYYLKGDSEDGNKKKKLKANGGSSKKRSVKKRQEIHTSSEAVPNTIAEWLEA